MKHTNFTIQAGQTLLVIPHGSHLYGTAGPSSDYDYKALYLPPLEKLVLGAKMEVLKYKFDEHGNTVGDYDSMPANGYEVEYIPLQKFVGDYLTGQAYAVEFVHAAKQGFAASYLTAPETAALLHFISTLPLHSGVDGMVGFAVKQTFDYVRRGERYTAACNMLAVVDEVMSKLKSDKQRLDTPYGESGMMVLDEIARATGARIGSSTNHNRVMRTLVLNGREYLETTNLVHFRAAIQKLADSYGHRSTAAAETTVEWKSLSHAVRVYQQVIELLTNGNIAFPRPNAESLKAIKNAEVQLSEVKNLLRQLDDQVDAVKLSSILPSPDQVTGEVTSNLMNLLLKDLYKVI